MVVQRTGLTPREQRLLPTYLVKEKKGINGRLSEHNPMGFGESRGLLPSEESFAEGLKGLQLDVKD